MQTSTLYPTIEEQNMYKRIIKRYGLTEASLMKSRPGQLYNNIHTVDTRRLLPTRTRKSKKC